jgi:hypothetical protein
MSSIPIMLMTSEFAASRIDGHASPSDAGLSCADGVRFIRERQGDRLVWLIYNAGINDDEIIEQRIHGRNVYAIARASGITVAE